MSFWGSVIGAGASLVGGLLGNSSSSKARAQADRHYQQEAAWRRTMATHGIQFRVQDAKKAGIHPVYAMGNTPTYTPISRNFSGDNFDWIGKTGQNLGRAIDAQQTKAERAKNDAYTGQMQKLSLERAQLQNDLLRSQIAVRAQAGQGPARPSVRRGSVDPNLTGQGDAGGRRTVGSAGVVVDPVKQSPVRKGTPSQAQGVHSSNTFLRTATGYSPVKAEKAAERLEDDFVGNLIHAGRRYLGPLFGIGRPPGFSPGKGKKWVWNPFQFEWQAKTKGKVPWYLKSYDPYNRNSSFYSKGSRRRSVPARTRHFRRGQPGWKTYGPKGRMQ